LHRYCFSSIIASWVFIQFVAVTRFRLLQSSVVFDAPPIILDTQSCRPTGTRQSLLEMLSSYVRISVRFPPFGFLQIGTQRQLLDPCLSGWPMVLGSPQTVSAATLSTLSLGLWFGFALSGFDFGICLGVRHYPICPYRVTP
jgi:hypothetical protein